jgi:hypothetical protein
VLGDVDLFCFSIIYLKKRDLKSGLNSGFHREVDENCVLMGYYAAGRSINTPQDISLNYTLSTQ